MKAVTTRSYDRAFPITESCSRPSETTFGSSTVASWLIGKVLMRKQPNVWRLNLINSLQRAQKAVAMSSWRNARRSAGRRKKRSWWCCLIRKFSRPFNPAELGARQRVRKRDVSLYARTTGGIRAWDTFQTLVATAKKLEVNIYQYFSDRLTQANQLPSLASLIQARAETLSLSASWKPDP